MGDSNRKEKHSKENQHSLDFTLDTTIITDQPPLFDRPSINFNLPFSSIDQQPPSPYASASSTESKLIKKVKRLKLTLDQSNKARDASFQADYHPQIPISSYRPSHGLSSGRPPRMPLRLAKLRKTQPTIGPLATSASGPIESAQQAKRDLNPAQIILQRPKKRARDNFKLERQKAKKARVDLVGPLMLSRIRPGLSPLGPGHLVPHDLVKHVLWNVKEFLNRLMRKKSFSKDSQPSNITPATPDPPPFRPVLLNATTSISASLTDHQTEPIAPAALALSTSSGLTVEQVLHMLHEYLETIPKTCSAQEMEDRLQEFQIRVKVGPWPSWYGLMTKSRLDFFDKLTEHFVCEALESDPEDDEEKAEMGVATDQVHEEKD